MASPSVRSESSNSGNGSSFSVTLPATINSGDLLIISISMVLPGTITWDNSTYGTWTNLYNTQTGLTVGRVYAKIATGSEDGGNLSITTTSNGYYAYKCYSIYDWYGAIATGVQVNAAVGSNTTPDPPVSTDAWGTVDRMTIAMALYQNPAAPSGFPSGYGNTGHTGFVICSAAWAYRAATEGVQNPGTFTTNSTAWHGVTISVRPGGTVYSETLTTRTYALTGTAAALNRGYRMTASSTTYALTGTAAGLLKKLRLIAASTSYSLTGTAANLLRGLILAANSTTYSLTGNAANLLKASLIDAAQGSFSLTGEDASLIRGLLMAADSTNYTLTGEDINFFRTLIFTADSGTFTLNGIDADLLQALRMPAVDGTFVTAGIDSALLKGYNLISETGTYLLSGQDAAFLQAYLLAADPENFILTGEDINLLKGYLLSGAGSYLLNGLDVNLDYEVADTLLADPGSFLFTGLDSNLLKGFNLDAGIGNYTWSGIDSDFYIARHLTADAGSFLLTGEDVNLPRTYLMTADGTVYVFTGISAGFNGGKYLAGLPGQFVLNGTDVSFSGKTLFCELAEYNLTMNNTPASYAVVYWSFALPKEVAAKFRCRRKTHRVKL